MPFTVPRKYRLRRGTLFRLHLRVLPATPDAITARQIVGRIADPYTGETIHVPTRHAIDSDKLMHKGMWRLWVFKNDNTAWKHIRYIQEFSPEQTPTEYAMLSAMVYGDEEYPQLWAPINLPLQRARQFIPNMPDGAYMSVFGMDEQTYKRNKWVVYVKCHGEDMFRPVRRYGTANEARSMRDAINMALEYVREYPEDIQAEIDAYNASKT
jgi:hypothetical protein